jgi:hypothetical protein
MTGYYTTLRPTASGECIYCQEPSAMLTEEHVLPAGLGGNRTLPHASCEKCRLITHEFETIALRKVIGPGRYQLGIPPRSKKKGRRPEDWTVFKTSPDGSAEKVSIPVNDLPFFVYMPTFQSDWTVSGFMPERHCASKEDGVVIVSEQPDVIKAKLAKYGADLVLQTADHLAFAKMICKIALGYTISEVGIENFTPIVNPLILGKTNGYRSVVSSSQHPDPSGEEPIRLEPRFEHHINHVVLTNDMICVRVDLLSNIRAPSYYVRVGMYGKGLELRFGASPPT